MWSRWQVSAIIPAHVTHFHTCLVLWEFAFRNQFPPRDSERQHALGWKVKNCRLTQELTRGFLRPFVGFMPQYWKGPVAKVTTPCSINDQRGLRGIWCLEQGHRVSSGALPRNEHFLTPRPWSSSPHNCTTLRWGAHADPATPITLL